MVPVLSQRRPAARAPFNPKNLSSLVAFLDASRQGANGGGHLTSAQVADFSGKGHHHAAGNDPLLIANQLNGKPTIRFQKSLTQYAQAAFTLVQPVHLFVVAKFPTPAVGGAETMWDGYTGNSMRMFDDTTAFDTYAGSFGPALTREFTSYHLYEAIYNGAFSKARKDRGAYATGNVGTAAPNGFTVAAFGSIAVPNDVYLAAAILCNAVQSPQNVNHVNGFINRIWGV